MIEQIASRELILICIVHVATITLLFSLFHACSWKRILLGFEETNKTICHDKESEKSYEEYSSCLSFEWCADISQDINQAGKHGWK